MKNRNKIWSLDIPLLTKRIRFTLGLKKREKPIPEFEQLGQAVDELKKAIMETHLGKFLDWILGRLSQMINWIMKILSRLKSH